MGQWRLICNYTDFGFSKKISQKSRKLFVHSTLRANLCRSTAQRWRHGMEPVGQGTTIRYIFESTWNRFWPILSTLAANISLMSEIIMLQVLNKFDLHDHNIIIAHLKELLENDEWDVFAIFSSFFLFSRIADDELSWSNINALKISRQRPSHLSNARFEAVLVPGTADQVHGIRSGIWYDRSHHFSFHSVARTNPIRICLGTKGINELWLISFRNTSFRRLTRASPSITWHDYSCVPQSGHYRRRFIDNYCYDCCNHESTSVLVQENDQVKNGLSF